MLAELCLKLAGVSGVKTMNFSPPDGTGHFKVVAGKVRGRGQNWARHQNQGETGIFETFEKWDVRHQAGGIGDRQEVLWHWGPI